MIAVFSVFTLPAQHRNIQDIDAAVCRRKVSSALLFVVISAFIWSYVGSEGHRDGIITTEDGANSRLNARPFTDSPWQHMDGGRLSTAPLTSDTVSISHCVHPAGDPKYYTDSHEQQKYLLATVWLESCQKQINIIFGRSWFRSSDGIFCLACYYS